MASFVIVDSLDQKRWDKFVNEHPKGSIFHTSAMVEVYRRTKNYQPLFLAALDQAGTVAALLVAVRVQTLPDPLSNFASRSIFYAEPLCREDACGIEALQVLIKEHDWLMKHKVLFTEIRPLCTPTLEKRALVAEGYAHEDYLNFLLNLRQPIDVIWSQVRKSSRGDIRRSLKRGVKIEEATDASCIDIIYPLLERTFKRARVPMADKSLFTEAFRILYPQERIRISIAYYEGQPVGATVNLHHQKKMVFAWYWGLERVQSIQPAECIIWHDIEWAYQQGYAVYDFGGAGWPNKPYGVRDFKEKFGGELVNYGRYRQVYSPWKFALAERGYDLARKIISPTNWRRV